MNPHVSPLVPLYITELLFGVMYALLIHWLATNSHLKGQTAYSVVVGDAATLIIQWFFFPQSWEPLVTFGSFVFSGVPMIVSYLFRHQQQVEKEIKSHKRRPLPNFVLDILERAVMELNAIADQIAHENATAAGTVQRLHKLISMLNSMKETH